jgi:hypothetical protein
MLKESILFVVATGALIYFVSPSDEPANAERLKEQVQKTVKPAVQASDDGWGDDENEEEGGENFTFGEPMTDPDSEIDDKPQNEDKPSDRQEQSENSGSKNTGTTSRRNARSANAPGSGKLGSIDNPIIFKTNNPPDPEDD